MNVNQYLREIDLELSTGVTLRVDVYPADLEVNPLFALHVKVNLSSLALSALADRLGESLARRKLAKVYARAVIAGSPDPPFKGYSQQDWEKFLEEHPMLFEGIRLWCENRENFGLPATRDTTATDRRPSGDGSGDHRP